MVWLFILSMGYCFFALSFFRAYEIKIFFAILFAIASIYCVIKKYPKTKFFSFKGKSQQLSITCVLMCILYVDFSSYIIHVSPSILRIIPISPTITAIIIAVICCLFSFLFLLEVAGYLNSVLCRLFYIIKSYRYSFILLSVIYLIGITAIVRADFSYYDDLGRVLNGLDMTGSFSRHTATILSNFLHGNTRLPDISPLPQILSVLIIAVAGVILLHLFDEVCQKSKRFDIWRVISLIPLCFSPYYLACLSYKFDSPYMAASILFSILPVIYYKASTKKYISAVAIGTILMCTTYQAASGIFPILVLLLAFLMWNQKEDLKYIVCFVLRSVCGYLGGLLIFRFLIMTPQETYIDSTISLKYVASNLSTYFTTFVTSFTPVWISLIVITCIVFVAVMVKISTRHIAVALPVTVLTMFCMVVLSFGVYIAFSDILLAVRSMYGLCVFFALLGLTITSFTRFPMVKFSAFLFSWLMFVFTFTYGNALSQQKEYTDFRTDEVISGIKQIVTTENSDAVYVQICGSIGYCDPVEDLIKEYPVLEKLVPVGLMGDNNNFGYYTLCNYYKLNLIYDETLDMTQLDIPVVSDTVYHTIKSKDNYILIYLK